MSGPLKTIDPTQFFADGVADINANFNTVLQIAQTQAAAHSDSGLASPVLMEQENVEDLQRWKLPEGCTDVFILFDHGFALRADQYTVSDGVVELAYTPAEPFALAAAWSPTLAGVTPPVSLTRGDNKKQWLLPNDASVNVLVFDRGQVLNRSEYWIDENVIYLVNDPISDVNQPDEYDISASWGSSGPGMTVPVVLEQGDTLRDWTLPTDVGKTVLVTDHGLLLDAQDYTVDLDTLTVTLNYDPEPGTYGTYAIAAFWGFTMDGLFMENVVPLPTADPKVFILPQDPIAHTLRLRARSSNGNAITHYVRGTDYTVVGRKITFGTAPEAGSTLLASMIAAVLNNDLNVDKVDGLDAVRADAADKRGKLVATDEVSGMLPVSIIPGVSTVSGFPAISSTSTAPDPEAGTTATAYYLLATGADGRFTNKALPLDPQLGPLNTSVVELQGLGIDINNVSEYYTYAVTDPTLLTQVEWKIDQTVVKRITWAYNIDGTIESRTDYIRSVQNETPYGSRTLQVTTVRTYTYNEDGQIAGVSKTVEHVYE